MIDSKGRWIPTLAPKGYDIFNDYHRFLLVEGPRKSSKTISVINKLARHLWENNNAMIGIIGKTLRNIKSSGVWQDLTKVECGLPQWLSAGIGFKYTVEPKITGDTKMTYFRVRNMHGGESECQVHSLEHEQDVETKFKSTRFSMIYLPEADQFKDRHTFDILEDQLRVIGIPYSEHQLIADCNPPEEGKDHWLYEVFFSQTDPDGKPFNEQYRSKFNRIHMAIDDNPFISEDEKETLRAKYRYDKNRYARLVDGKWEHDQAVGHFAEFFIENIHVRGLAESPEESEWTILVPTAGCAELLTGWDLGDVNHAVSIIAPRDAGEKTAYDVIDEVVVLKRKVSIDDFTEMVMERMEFWESYMRETHGREKLKWKHYADPSVNVYHSAADMHEALMVRMASGGKINLKGVPKGRHSIQKRVTLTKRLLFDNQLFISAQCRFHIDMLRFLRRGTVKTETIDPKSPHKHIFDAMTYALIEEVPEELSRRDEEPTVASRIVSVNYG